MSCSLSGFLDEPEFVDTTFHGGDHDDDLFAIFESLGSVTEFPPATPLVDLVVSSKEKEKTRTQVSHKSTSSSALQESETELETSPRSNKRQKTTVTATSDEINPDGQQRISHITVERNRRKQMNEHLSVLRSLMPCFYVKRGDQASIIGGVVDYINELQQVLQSLEAKKQRKLYSEVLSPRLVLTPLSPRKPPLSPRLNLPISPSTPQSGSPYWPRVLQQGHLSSPTTMATALDPSPTSSASSSINNSMNELVANSKSSVADVEVKFSGPNVLLKTASPRIRGQAVKIISALEDLSLEILDVTINTVEETMLNSFTIKIGIECQLSAEDVVQQVQQTFC
ncbi:hypothetical protein K2173_011850 [Erythroxylum novogranatense]|uniref:BHLH domain-containing protein n=1 Tax=Erythroxylum novogranatense TaxID=1862640 RepID=A0AAV8SLD5_9ROSI|nr:hypothetical protein K2173_011850 [Erythroxylum novogranatense]